MFNWLQNKLWNWQLKQRYGIPNASHLSLSYDFCEMVVWNKDDVPYLYEDASNLDITEKLLNEWKDSERNTVVKPDQYRRAYNIITNVGLLEMAKRDAGTSSTTNLWYMFGTGSTTEQLTDTDIETDAYSASFASKGTRGTIDASRTGKYLMPILDTDYTGNLSEAGLATGNNPPTDKLITHYTFPTITISSLQLASALTTIVYKNGTV